MADMEVTLLKILLKIIYDMTWNQRGINVGFHDSWGAISFVAMLYCLCVETKQNLGLSLRVQDCVVQT